MPSLPSSQQQQMHRWQEDQIRRTVRTLGFDPQALPPDDRQRAFVVKSLIRARCEKNYPVKLRAAMFNHAWERMLASTPPALRYAVL